MPKPTKSMKTVRKTMRTEGFLMRNGRAAFPFCQTYESTTWRESNYRCAVVKRGTKTQFGWKTEFRLPHTRPRPNLPALFFQPVKAVAKHTVGHGEVGADHRHRGIRHRHPIGGAEVRIGLKLEASKIRRPCDDCLGRRS